MFGGGLFWHNAKNIIIKKRIGYILLFLVVFTASFLLSCYLVSTSNRNAELKKFEEEKNQITTHYEEIISEKDSIITALTDEIDSLKSAISEDSLAENTEE